MMKIGMNTLVKQYERNEAEINRLCWLHPEIPRSIFEIEASPDMADLWYSEQIYLRGVCL